MNKMKSIHFLIKPSSSACNLRCKYCFYSDVSNRRKIKNYGFMNNETMTNLIDTAFSMVYDSATINFAFQGGEPTLIGVEFYRNFINYVESKRIKHRIEYSIQTNSYKLDEEFYKIFKYNNFLVGVSLDGYKENNDIYRLSPKHDSTFNAIKKTINSFNRYHIEYNIVSVLTKNLSRNAKKYYEFIKSNDFRHSQIIACLAPLDKSIKESNSINAREFADFHKTLFDLWFDDYIKGEYYSINVFDNYIRFFMGDINTICGISGRCSKQYVVESNGNVYPCDFYTLDNLLLGNVNDSEKEFNHQNFLQFTKARKTTNCDRCKFSQLCNGGCFRYKNTYHDGNYCGLQDFLEYTHARMIYIGKAL